MLPATARHPSGDDGLTDHCGCCAHSRASGCGGPHCPCRPRSPRRYPRDLTAVSTGRLEWETQEFANDLSGCLKHLDDRDWGRILAQLDPRDRQRLARLLIRELP